MYTHFYDLDKAPFENTPDTDFLCPSGPHRAVLAALRFGVRSGRELLLVTGDVGTGKTILLQALMENLAPNYFAVHIPNPLPGFSGILYHLMQQLSIYTEDPLDAADLGRNIRFRLDQASKGGMRAMLVIDEAHLLEEPCLQDLKSLADEVNRKKCRLQIILAGQREILGTLKKPSLAPLQQRIAVRCNIEPLSLEEVRTYIASRLRQAGRRTPLFDRRAEERIWEKSGGAPRAVNRICDNALFAGYAVGARRIGTRIVEKAAAATDFSQTSPWRGPRNYSGCSSGFKHTLAIAAAMLLMLILLRS
jgi:type II secretory pathway predicted ATPase ExeA